MISDEDLLAYKLAGEVPAEKIQVFARRLFKSEFMYIIDYGESGNNIMLTYHVAGCTEQKEVILKHTRELSEVLFNCRSLMHQKQFERQCVGRGLRHANK